MWHMINAMERLPIMIPTTMRQALDSLVNRTGLSLAEHVRRAIDAYLRKEGK